MPHALSAQSKPMTWGVVRSDYVAAEAFSAVSSSNFTECSRPLAMDGHALVIRFRALLSRFRDLGHLIGDAWKARRREERAFPEIARRALEETALERHYTFESLVLELAGTDPLPAQNILDESFGQPPMTVFQGDGFNIELLFWIDGLVTIHQHGFSGAFSVFEGSSVHTRYRFAEKKRVNATVLFGDLLLESAELLSRGDVREIVAGRPLIHATFHLDRPTVSLVVRTERDHEGLPQYDYRPPSLAFDPFAARTLLRKRLQFLRMLHRSRRESYWAVAASILAPGDFLTTYFVLDQGYTLTDGAEASEAARDRARLVALARAGHDEDIDALVPVLEAGAARRGLIARRDAETDAEMRFFLAVVLTVPDRRTLLDLVAKRYPMEAPAELVIRCLGKLGFDADALVLSRVLLAGDAGSDVLKSRIAEVSAGRAFPNDYSLLQAVRTLRATPGLRALLT